MHINFKWLLIIAIINLALVSQIVHAIVKLPNPISIHIQIFKSAGFRAFISPLIFGSNGIELFAFYSNVNAPIRLLESGRYSGIITKPDHNGCWIYRNNLAILEVGDVLNYWVYIEVNGAGYKVDTRSYIVDKEDKG